MKYFTVSCFVALILATNAWQDYADYYDYDDELYEDNIDTKTLKVRLGSKVSLICNYNPLDALWKHNGNMYHPFVTEPPVTDWLGISASSIEIQISSKNDTGIWGCHSLFKKGIIYNITLSTEDDESTEPAQPLKAYRYATDEQSTITSKILLNTPALQYSSTEHSTPPSTVPMSIHSTTITSSSSLTVYPTKQVTNEVTIQQRSTTGQSVTKSKLLENESENLAYLIKKELSYSFDNPFFKLKSKTMAKSSSIQTSVSYVILLLLMIEMLVCLWRI